MFRPRFPSDATAPLPVPTDQMTDPPLYCVKMNGEWLTYLTGVVERLGRDSRYDLDSQEEHDQIFTNVHEMLARFADAAECVEPVTYEIQTFTIEHRLAQNVAGGATVANAWTTVPYNVLVQDDTGQVVFGGDAFTLPVGVWDIEATHVIRSNAAMNARIRIGAGSTLVSENIAHPATTVKLHRVRAVIPVVIPAAKVIEYYVTSALAVNGLGLPMNVAGEQEVYGKVTCRRLTLIP